MKNKPKIIVVEDEEFWLATLKEIIVENFDVDVEEFLSFTEAEKRILKKSEHFDILVTDVFAKHDAKYMQGLTFAKFVNEIRNVPVLVVTGASDIITAIAKNPNVIDVFDKGYFDRIEFTLALKKLLDNDTETLDNVDYSLYEKKIDNKNQKENAHDKKKGDDPDFVIF